MKIINKFKNTKQYLSKFWNNQKTFKYLININNKLVEVGYFIHCFDGKVIRHVIELSTSHGCPMKCKFCASSVITSVNGLDVSEMIEVFEYIYLEHNLSIYDYVLVAMTGIGELYYTNDNVIQFIVAVNKNHGNLRFATSSCCMDVTLFNVLEEMNKRVIFDNVQITHLSLDAGKIKYLIPGIPKIVHSSDIVRFISVSEINVIRINYLLVKDTNDSMNDIDDFIECYSPVKDKITVKVSTLNTTDASISNKIESGSLDRAKEFCSHLEDDGFSCYVFHAFHDDKMNCGQLISENSNLWDCVDIKKL